MSSAYDGPVDYLILGGGTAGCVLAARLSERADLRVMLVEAGADLLPGREPDSVLDPFPISYGDPQFLWPDLTVCADSEHRPGVRVRPIQGKGVGGSSAIMGMWATRGLAADYDEWRAEGAFGWGWSDVLPYFRKLERDLDFGDRDVHGNSGPIIVRRHPTREWPGFSRRLSELLIRRGARFSEDMNDGDDRDALAPAPMNNSPQRRSFASADYLTASVRQRPNLAIVCHAVAKRLVFRNGAATGAELVTANGARMVRSQEVILACGAIQSPAILLRSGVGDSDVLRQCGIEVIVDNAAVGRGLQHHPTLRVATLLSARGRQPGSVRGGAFWGWRHSSGLPDCAPADMFLWPINKAAWHALGERVGAIGVCVNRSYSQGNVTLRDPRKPAVVNLGLLSDERDVARLTGGLARILELLGDESLDGVREEVFWPDEVLAARLNAPNARTAALARLLASAIEWSAPVRRFAVRKGAIAPRRMATRELRSLVFEKASAAPHFAGSCRLGAPDDLRAALDPRCRVKGVQGVRVADASVMPSLVRGNPHLPVLMIAEKAAEMILQDHARR